MAASWRKIPESGTVLGIRLIVWVARIFRRRGASWFLYLLAIYYALFHRTARRASSAYLRRVGQPATFGNIVRHLHTFAQVSLDRLFFLTGRWAPFRVEHPNHDALVHAARSGRGVLLLGAHVGSFEVMRCRAEERGVPVNIVVDFANAERVNGVLRALAPRMDTRVIALGADPLATMLAIKACIERGELVAILGDRTRAGGAGAGERTVMARFLGADAAFPAGPWLLAHTLHCPVYFVAGIYTRPNHYTLHCELLVDEVKLERATRAAALERYAQAYAAVLEKYVRLAPFNWFNFFDFWSNRE